MLLEKNPSFNLTMFISLHAGAVSGLKQIFKLARKFPVTK